MNNIEVTSTKILPIENGIGGCVAIAQLVLNESIKLTGIKLIITESGKRIVSYPRNTSNKMKRPFFYPVTAEMGNEIADRLWEDYDATLNG